MQKDFLASRIEDASREALDKGKAVYLDFFEPVIQYHIEREIARYQGCGCLFFGGHDFCERKMLAVFPSGIDTDTESYPIDCLKITSSNALTHPDVLGSILGLGIERDKVGDISFSEKTAQIFVASPLGKFIADNLTRVRSFGVTVKQIEKDEITVSEPKFTELGIIVPSLRVDAVIHSVYRMSRSEAADYVKAEKVFINHAPIAKPSALVKIGDTVSVRSKGRFIADSISGTTKKGNTKLIVKKFS